MTEIIAEKNKSKMLTVKLCWKLKFLEKPAEYIETQEYTNDQHDPATVKTFADKLGKENLQIYYRSMITKSRKLIKQMTKKSY
jgi:hypothetical protein